MADLSLKGIDEELMTAVRVKAAGAGKTIRQYVLEVLEMATDGLEVVRKPLAAQASSDPVIGDLTAKLKKEEPEPTGMKAIEKLLQSKQMTRGFQRRKDYQRCGVNGCVGILCDVGRGMAACGNSVCDNFGIEIPMDLEHYIYSRAKR